jgi:N-acetylmuramoyl-L-alanine amidase
MSYQYLTQWDSPNYTPANQTKSTWGVNRQIKEIAIHWWNAPGAGATFEGVVGGFLKPGGLSAHYIATGNGRRVACLVNPLDNSWATGPGNPYTISIECDPAQTDQDYDTIAELIADIRSAYGDFPLVPHSKYVNTRCSGTYDLARLDREARGKFSHATDWGKGGSIAPPAPKVTREQIAAAYLEVLERAHDEGGMQTYLNSGFDIERIKNEMRNSNEYATLKVNKANAAQAALDAARKAAEEQARLDAERAERDRASKAAEEAAKKAAEEAAKNGYNQSDRDRDNSIAELLRKVWEFITNIFKGNK